MVLLANLLQNAMDAKNLKRKDLAKKAGVNYETINNYLSGKSEPNISTLILLAEALEIDPASLISPKTSLMASKYNRLVRGINFEINKLLEESVQPGIVNAIVKEERLQIIEDLRKIVNDAT